MKSMIAFLVHNFIFIDIPALMGVGRLLRKVLKSQWNSKTTLQRAILFYHIFEFRSITKNACPHLYIASNWIGYIHVLSYSGGSNHGTEIDQHRGYPWRRCSLLLLSRTHYKERFHNAFGPLPSHNFTLHLDSNYIWYIFSYSGGSNHGTEVHQHRGHPWGRCGLLLLSRTHYKERFQNAFGPQWNWRDM